MEQITGIDHQECQQGDRGGRIPDKRHVWHTRYPIRTLSPDGIGRDSWPEKGIRGRGTRLQGPVLASGVIRWLLPGDGSSRYQAGGGLGDSLSLNRVSKINLMGSRMKPEKVNRQEQ